MFLWFVMAVAFTICGATVQLGNKTFFGHVSAIWSSDEVQDAKQGIGEKAGPALDTAADKAGPALERARRAGKKALEEMTKDPPAPAPDAGRR
jgi:hypothetical protein